MHCQAEHALLKLLHAVAAALHQPGLGLGGGQAGKANAGKEAGCTEGGYGNPSPPAIEPAPMASETIQQLQPPQPT